MIRRIVLASSSPRRREILERFHLKLDVIPSDADENVTSFGSEKDYVCELSRRKGRTVREKLTAEGTDIKDTLFISCDTIVACDGKIIGKPSGRQDALDTIKMLSGREHSVFSGLYLQLNDTTYCGADETKVFFADITEREAEKYVDSGEPMGKAGSYAIQGLGSAFVRGIEGDYSTVVGFPLSLFCRVLKKEFDTSIDELGEIK